MKYEDLRIRIQKARQEGLLLEAFLIQSAYVEGVFNLYIDLNIKVALEKHDELMSENIYEESIKNTINDRIRRYGLDAMIHFMYDSKLINMEEKKLFDKYRTNRNKLIHHLLEHINTDIFERELLIFLDKGDLIIKNKKFGIVNNLFNITENKKQRLVGPNYFDFKPKRSRYQIEIKVIQLKLSGMTLDQIGKRFNITGERARQLFLSGLQHYYANNPRKNNSSISLRIPSDKRPESIIESVAGQFDLDAEKLLGKKRDKELVFPRHIAMYLLRHKTNPKLSFPAIAKQMQKRDHTTILHACNKVRKFVRLGKIVFNDSIE